MKHGNLKEFITTQYVKKKQLKFLVNLCCTINFMQRRPITAAFTSPEKQNRKFTCYSTHKARHTLKRLSFPECLPLLDCEVFHNHLRCLHHFSRKDENNF